MAKYLSDNLLLTVSKVFRDCILSFGSSNYPDIYQAMNLIYSDTQIFQFLEKLKSGFEKISNSQIAFCNLYA